MTSVERYPLDFEALNRGDTIPAERIERIYGISRNHRDYWSKQLRLRDQIEDHFLSVRGDDVSVKIESGDLVILGHRDQAHYTQQRARAAIRQYGKSFRKASAVDQSHLSDEERERHDRFVHVTGFRIQQLRKQPPPRLTDRQEDA
jgi:hypothetical protein